MAENAASIFEKIMNDYNAARKDRDEAGEVRDKVLVAALGVVIADSNGLAKKRAKVEERSVTNSDVVKVLKDAVVTATANIETWESQGRDAGAIRREMAILKSYLPEDVDPAEVRAAIKGFADDDAVRSNPRAGQGIVINKLKELYGERYDKAWSAIVREVIGV